MQEIASFEDVKTVGGREVASALFENTPRLEEAPTQGQGWTRSGPVVQSS